MVWITNQSFMLDLGLNSEIYKDLSLVWISPGIFMMGSPLGEPRRNAYDDELPFQVTISKGFWLSQYLVTNAQWLKVMGSLPFLLTDENSDYPVTNVSWYQALDFCNKLNQLFEKEMPEGYKFSLPTEAQWEYACRAGTETVYHSGNSLSDLDRVAWHKENSSGHVHPVGQKEPNAWGLYDMHGNVAEWCFDTPNRYPSSPAVDWVGVDYESIKVRAVRGEAWSAPSNSPGFKSSSRGDYPADKSLQYIGFRISLRPI